MGKKGKRAKAKAAAPKEEELRPEPECPPDGWALELIFADREAKQNASAAAHLRVAIAACQLRQWEQCQAACSLGLTLMSDDDAMKKELLYYQKRATAELKAANGSEVHSRDLQQTFQKFMRDEVGIDCTPSYHPTFDNLNLFHYAALVGDLPLLEKLVAMGAAIDYPVLDESEPIAGACPAPDGSTALVLACSILAMYKRMGMTPKMMTKEMKKQQRGSEECAIALVNLGADTTKTVQRPPHNLIPSNPEATLALYNNLSLFDKSAKELAAIAGKPALVEAMTNMETKEDRLARAHCRCGSRLPWLQCHAGARQDENKVAVGSDCGQYWHFRYSPLAPCPCKHKAKIYWRCCWEQTAMPKYQNDSLGELVHFKRFNAQNPAGKAVIESICRRMNNLNTTDKNASMFPEFEGMTAKEIQAATASVIRSKGFPRSLPSKPHPNSKVDRFDPEVYAGCVERLDDFFFWNDCHWFLDKTELKVRVKEWNAALEQYCDDMGLSGEKRQSVIEQNAATSCAPCANPGCDAWEEKAKEFLRCSRCKMVAYCSVKCQHKAWKEHKKGCSSA